MGQEVRRQSQESLETVKKDIDHPHFQARIPFIKDFENYFVWNDEDSKYKAKDDADSTHILKLLQNPTSAEFKVGPKKAETRINTPGLSAKDLLKAEASNPARKVSLGEAENMGAAAEEDQQDSQQQLLVTPWK